MKSEKPKNIICTSLQRYFNRDSARFCCIKSHEHLALKNKIWILKYSLLSLNTSLINSLWTSKSSNSKELM